MPGTYAPAHIPLTQAWPFAQSWSVLHAAGVATHVPHIGIPSGQAAPEQQSPLEGWMQ